MALHPDFPDSPHAILEPSIRWFPADETLRETNDGQADAPAGAAAPPEGEGVPRQRVCGRGGKGDAEIRDTIKLRQTRPCVARDQGYLMPKKSVFNRIIGDSPFELTFASFLENCDDVASYGKNYLAVHFKLDYVNADGNISNYYPDFLVKLTDSRIVIVETKGQEDLDVPLKTQRLRQWCEDVNRVQSAVTYDFVYVDEESFEKYHPKSFKQLLDGFIAYKGEV